MKIYICELLLKTYILRRNQWACIARCINTLLVLAKHFGRCFLIYISTAYQEQQGSAECFVLSIILIFLPLFKSVQERGGMQQRCPTGIVCGMLLNQ